MRPSQNLPLPPRIHPLFNKCICATLPESTPHSQNIPPFQQMYNYVRRSQNLPLSPKYNPLQQLYAVLPESTPSSQNIPPFQTTML